jgi:tetratricopeptide (TPR) repeat protein
VKTIVSFAKALKLAGDHVRGGDYPQAEAILRRLAQTKPEHELVQDLLIQALCHQGKAADAMRLYDEAVGRGAHACDPRYDALYRRALIATGNCPSPLKRRLRFRKLLELLSRVLELDGCVAECGCSRGMSSYLILSKLRLHDPKFDGHGYHVFDSFEGLSTPTEEDEVADSDPNAEDLRKMSTPGAFRASLEEVRQALAEFPFVEYHPGWIPLSFSGLPERKYRFVHLDVDLYGPTLAALDYFHPRMTRGGVIVSDDYTWPGARRAVEEYCRRNGAGYRVTEHGQAVIMCP